MHDHSFEFNNTDMLTEYGIRVRQRHEVLKPPLRARKVIIPTRSGAYDYGAKWYDERTLLVECDTITQLTKSQRRELSLLLSKKGRITFWDEPDKYYIGRIYDASETERVGGIGTYFPLTFICDPFLYGKQVTQYYSTRHGGSFTTEVVITPEYGGTAETPMVITIRNPDSSYSNIQIAIRKRRE